MTLSQTGYFEKDTACFFIFLTGFSRDSPNYTVMLKTFVKIHSRDPSQVRALLPGGVETPFFL